MAISKNQVFIVAGRLSPKDKSRPVGPVLNQVVCSTDVDAVRRLLLKDSPDFFVLSITSLAALETTAAYVRAVLKGETRDCLLVVDPALQSRAAA